MWRYLNVHLIQLELTWGHSDEGYWRSAVSFKSSNTCSDTAMAQHQHSLSKHACFQAFM